MWVVYLEVALAFLLAVLIVWWTWPKKRPQDKPKPEDARGGQGPKDG